ncbi:MAG: phenylalanine--tRNA ligase subunit alpha [Bombilactobacillus mellifer]|nr:phenylalanine--tRNA ligase subunit alpha [Bombilactobacillus mellifer]
MDLEKELIQLQKDISEKFASIKSTEEINSFKVEILGKKGRLTRILKSLSTLSKDQRKNIGQKANEIRDMVNQKIEIKQQEIAQKLIAQEIVKDTIDVTLPGKKPLIGSKHVLNIIIDDLVDFFRSMGFSINEGTEIEDDKHNFEMLNIPKGHPARDMQDTFFLTNGLENDLLLRSQTSPSQAHDLENHDFSNGPIRMISYGRVFRRDDDDATHSHQFYQMEGFVVDRHITMSDLFGTLNLTLKHVFGDDREVRFRPSYFPFTEPSVEADVSCFFCNGKGCSICKNTGWIEVLGAGLTHPNVFKAAGVDPKQYQGFAFGMGIDRFAILKYGISDIRDLYTNDVRFLKQFEGEN